MKNFYIMKQILIPALTLLLFFNSLIAQEAPIEWGKVPIEDLQMASYALDTSASAVVLCDFGEYCFDVASNSHTLYLFNKRHLRIKILKKEGIKYAKSKIIYIDIPRKGYNLVNPIQVKGITYNLSAKGKVISTKIKEKSINYTDSINNIRIAELKLPDVKVGSIIDLYFEIPTFDYIQPQSWYFQREIPVRHSEFRMQVPNDLEYLFSTANFESFDKSKEEEFNKTLIIAPVKTFSPHHSGRTKYFYSHSEERFENIPISITKSNGSLLSSRATSSHLKLSGKQMRFIKLNNKAIKHQDFIYNIERHVQKLNIHLKTAINTPRGPVWGNLMNAIYSGTIKEIEEYKDFKKNSFYLPPGYICYNMYYWKVVNEQLIKSDGFGRPLNEYWNYKPHLNNVIAGKTKKTETMKAIYDYVRKNIKWNGEYDIYVGSIFNSGSLYTKTTKKLKKETSLKKPFEAKSGKSNEINLILISLLNNASIEAHPVLISTRDNKQVDLNIADADQFNHVIALAKIGDKEFLLDATDSMRPYQYLDKNHLVKNALLVDSTELNWLNPKFQIQTSTNVIEKITLANNSTMNQNISIQSIGYNAIETRRDIKNKGIEMVKDEIANEFKIEKVDTIENIDDENHAIIFNFENKTHLDNIDVSN